MKYKPPPTLRQFLRNNAFIRCAIGPVGSGKSSACVIELLRRATEQKTGPDGIRRTRFAVIRNTYRELRDTTRKTFEQWIPQQIGKWREQDFAFTIQNGDIESEVLFRSLDRVEDIKKLLSLELTGAWINEAREVPREILDMLTVRVGRYPSKAQGGPSWRGIWMDTNPWHANHAWSKFFQSLHETPQELLSKLGLKDHSEYAQLFRQPSGRSPQAENLEHLDAGYYEKACIGKDSEWIKVYVDGLDATAVQGSVYGHLLAMLREHGGVGAFQHDTDEVFTTWDLGFSDSTAIWFWRFNGKGGVDLIDWHEDNGKAIFEYFPVVDRKPYKYFKHWFPHDVRNRSGQTGLSTMQIVAQHYPNQFGVVPRLDVEHGIDAARWLLEQPTRFHVRCSEGIERLAEYRYEWDEENKVFSKNPLHNFASHTADAFRYLACVVKLSEVLTRKPPPAKEVKIPPMAEAYKLEELYEQLQDRGDERI